MFHAPTLQSETDALTDTLRRTKLVTPFETPGANNVGGISDQLKLIAKLITIRNERGHGINRDVFYCEMGGEFTYVRTHFSRFIYLTISMHLSQVSIHISK